jgi:transposase
MLPELNVVEQRYRAVVEVLFRTAVIEIAERCGVARQTVHRWMARYRAGPPITSRANLLRARQPGN